MSIHSSRARSSVWRRTVYYFLVIVGIFIASGGLLLYFAGYERTDSELIVAVTRSDLTHRNRVLLDLKTRMADAGANPAATAVLDDELRRNAERLDALQKLRELELTPKNAGNQNRILEELERNYAELRAAYIHQEIGALIRKQYVRFAFVLLFFFLAISIVLYILIKMILNPLETLIQGARRVAEGDVEVSFRLATKDELGELASVLGDLSSNFRELLTLMKSSSQSGIELSGKLVDSIEAAGDSSSETEARAAQARELRVLFQKIQEITDYFTFSRVHR